MKASFRLKTTSPRGTIYTSEIFVSNYSVTVHKHSLTSDEELATHLGIVRKFWNKYYTKQEITMSKTELREYYRIFSENENFLKLLIEDNEK